MLQIIRSPQVFDVVVIGSGAGGGTAVKVLTDRGLNVALLEAGPMLHPETDFQEHVAPYDVDHRRARPPARLHLRPGPPLGCFPSPHRHWATPTAPPTA